MASIEERIAKRAYDLFIARGGQHGYHLQDWLEAERQIHGEAEREGKPVAKSPARKKAPKKDKS